jgi:hypothetical protein
MSNKVSAETPATGKLNYGVTKGQKGYLSRFGGNPRGVLLDAGIRSAE